MNNTDLTNEEIIDAPIVEDDEVTVAEVEATTVEEVAE